MNKINMQFIGLAVAATAVLSGCATSKAGCDTRDASTREYCRSVMDTQRAAQAGGGTDFSVHDGGGAGDGPQQPIWAPGRMINGAVVSGKNALAGPVFTPAKPHRVWVAPWTDTNGTLHSGEYLYYVTPGHWNYGELRAPGSASDALGPLRTDDYGFEPNTEAEAEQGPIGPELSLTEPDGRRRR